MKPKILFLKALGKFLLSTEETVLNVLNDPKYDKYEKYINKDEIQAAFDEYGYKLNPFNSMIYANVLNSPNIEGHYLAKNLPEIDSVVFEEPCTSNEIHRIMDKNDDITHIGISAYSYRLDSVVNLIKTIQKDFPDKELYVGNVGATYSYIKKLIKPQNLCFGDGIIWLRDKFNLPKLTRDKYRISTLISGTDILPINMKTAYIVTQTGCPFGCDFCITSKMLSYNPFSNAKKIINALDNILEQINDDVFLYLCEPNACYPEQVWKEVFEYYVNQKRVSDKTMHILCLISLNHLQNFNLEKIQENSALKFFFVNYGIESTLTGGYKKNKGVSNKFIRSLSQKGIVTNHNYILGLPWHDKENINLEIKRNLEYDSCWYFISTLRPFPMTDIYQQLEREGRMYDDDLPPEFICREGFFAFDHEHLGGGYSALKYAFKAYYETEKKVVDVYSRFVETLLNSSLLEHSDKMRKVIRAFDKLSEMNYSLFEPRMNKDLSNRYKNRLHHYQSEIKARIN